MEKLLFDITIDADRQKVWDTMLNPATYKEWVNVSWPGSYYKGTWKKGENLRFLSPNQGGTLANLVEHKPYEHMLLKHIAVIGGDGSEDRDSDIAKGWIGTTEAYTFTESKGKTTITVELNTSPAWAEMFSEGWPNALAKLKELSEK